MHTAVIIFLTYRGYQAAHKIQEQLFNTLFSVQSKTCTKLC